MTPRQCRREISARAAVPRRLHTREAAPRRRVGATAVVGARGAIFVTGDADMEMQDIDVAQRMVEVHAALAAAVGLDAIMGAIVAARTQDHRQYFLKLSISMTTDMRPRGHVAPERRDFTRPWPIAHVRVAHDAW